jgi:amidase
MGSRSPNSPSWREAHSAAIHNELCVDQPLAAGATCIGKVVTYEFTYSLDSERQFFGTTINAKSPDRIPGGSAARLQSGVRL